MYCGTEVGLLTLAVGLGVVCLVIFHCLRTRYKTVQDRLVAIDGVNNRVT